jgi:hypothetical protein
VKFFSYYDYRITPYNIIVDSAHVRLIFVATIDYETAIFTTKISRFTALELTYRVSLIFEFDGFWYVHLVLPEVVEWSLYKYTLLLVLLDQLIPKRMLCVCGGGGG